MIRTSKHISTFAGGIDRDTSVNKTDNTHYYDAENMRIMSEDPSSMGAMTNVKGNLLRLTFDAGDVILGHCKIRSNYTEPTKDSIVFFVYNATGTSSKIYLFEGDPYLVEENVVMGIPFQALTYGSYNYKAGYIYANSDLGFDPSYPIRAEGRYESALIRKVYWVDGLNYIRYMILDRVNDSDPVTIFDINPSSILTEATTSLLSGGAYLAGKVQYSYQLYIQNGAATTYAPLSPMIYLTGNDKGVNSRTYTGSELASNTGKAVNVTINNLDITYNRIRIVALHYTEYLVNPTVNIIGEFDYDGSYISITDNGYSNYGTIDLAEFRLFGQTNYIANYLASKNNYLFFADITEDKWNPVWLDPTNGSFWDSRAIRFNATDARIRDGISTVTVTTPAFPVQISSWNTAGWTNYILDHDGINDFNDIDNDGDPTKAFMFQSDKSTIGAEGPNVIIDIEHEHLTIDSESVGAGYTEAAYSSVKLNEYANSPVLSSHASSQRTEVYRMFIAFINTKMQYSQPQWICDFRMPTNNEYELVTYNVNTGAREGMYLYPKVTLRNMPSDAELYGWQIFRCERGSTDRSIMSSGIISPCMTDITIHGVQTASPYSQDSYPYCFNLAEAMSPLVDLSIVELLSPEISFNKNLRYTGGDKLRVDGRYLIYGYQRALNGANSDRLVTLSLGATNPTHANDTLYYDILDGAFQAPDVLRGDPLVFPPPQVIGSKTYRHYLYYNDATTYWRGNRGSSFVANIDADLSVDGTSVGIPMGSYVRNVFNTQYNGNTYEARSYNSVIPYSGVVPKATLENICYNGDTYITMFAYLRASKPDVGYNATHIFQQEMVYIPSESSINCYYRLDPVQKYYSPTEMTYMLQETLEQGMVLQPLTYPIELGDLYRYNSVYSKSGNGILLQNTVFDSNNIEHSDVKVIATEKKINNEYFDSWTNLYTNNYIEVDPRFGAIRNIFNYNNKLFAGQDKAISVLAVQDRSMIQDNSKLGLTLGTGEVLARYDYLTTSSGFQSYYDMCLSDRMFYYLDRRNKIIHSFGEDGDNMISEVRGYRSYLKSLSGISVVKTGYDPIYKEVFFYIEDANDNNNSVYSEYTNSFVGKHTFEPSNYGTSMFNFNDQFYSIYDNTLWIHNYGEYGSFYGTIYDSTFTLNINPDGNIVDRFDVLDMRVDVIDTDLTTYLETEQFDHMLVTNNYQTLSKDLLFSGDDSSEDTTKELARQWRTQLIPDLDSDEVYRITDTYMKVKLTRHNTGNKRLVLHDIITYYRPIKG
jgi:hypothetical protein